MKIRNAVKDTLASQTPSCHSGIVVNSYYGRDAETTAFCDVALQDEGGMTELLAKVPVIKIGGVSSSLPPVGSSAIVIYIDNNEKNPIVIGTIDTKITETFVKDTKRPRRPPTNLTR